MKDCIIGIPIKNNSIYLEKFFKHLITLKKCFNKYQIIFVYDNITLNTDNSIELINNFIKDNNNLNIKLLESCNELHDINIQIEQRVIHICNARNTILEYIRKYCNNYHYFIMMDANYSCTENIETFDIEKIKHYLNKDNEWDAISFNRKNYYDIWALSLKPYITSCWHCIRDSTFNLLQRETIFTKIKENFYKNINNISQKELLDVHSAFCGFAIYKTNIFLKSHYHYLMDLSLFDKDELKESINLLPFSKKTMMIHSDCEHRYFHLNAKKKLNARIKLANDDIFIYKSK
uniref:Glycosyltransferase 2-like domain-containing protein n=1 Tax=viral metagenome TaxID=1070528 RepID=A0A6C0KER0_9ZZZZ